jgi:hypothetical protein
MEAYAANPSWPRFTLAQSAPDVYEMGLKCTMEDPEMFILEAALRDPELLEASRARTRSARASSGVEGGGEGAPPWLV